MACIDVYTLRDRAAGHAASVEAQDSLHNIETAVSKLVEVLEANGICDADAQRCLMDTIDNLDGFADLYTMANEEAA